MMRIAKTNAFKKLCIKISASINDEIASVAVVIKQVLKAFDADNLYPAVRVLSEGGAKETISEKGIRKHKSTSEIKFCEGQVHSIKRFSPFFRLSTHNYKTGVWCNFWRVFYKMF
jgi:hypothetical protein